MDAPEILVERMNIEERFEDMFCRYFARNIGDGVQLLKTFDYLDKPTDYIVVNLSLGASTGREFPRTELTGFNEERAFSATLNILIVCGRRTVNSKIQIRRLASIIRALMLRGILFKAPELLALVDEYAGLNPQSFGGIEYSADDDGDVAHLQYNFEIHLNEKIFKQ